ncbi:RCC1 domain-containing protein [Aeromonas hydrophila]|uniref:hypothetical protein n=1 Tax=Aeromonas hydrophila TaxID=644 RepID=UPI000AFD8E04|nr:hypothetical protein [Aeromonas hydrophila]HAU4928784.1 hypothetical protein [Aeromonas hydrophila]
MRILLPIVLSSIVFGCGGGDEQKQQQPDNSNSHTGPGITAPQQPGTPPSQPPKTDPAPDGNNPPSVEGPAQPSLPEKLNVQFKLFVTPKNYGAGEQLNVFSQLEHLGAPDLDLRCSWIVKDVKVSDTCSYQLAKADHLHPITISAYLQNTKGQKSDVVNMTFQKAFPLTHLRNAFGNSMLMSDGSIHTWGLPNENDFNALTSKLPPADVAERKDYVLLTSNQDTFVALSKSGEVTAWGKRRHGANVPPSILAEQIQNVVPSDYAFAALSKAGKVYVWGSLNGLKSGPELPISGNVIQLYGLSSGFIALTDEGIAYGVGNGIPLKSYSVGSIKKAVSTQAFNGNIVNKYSMAILNDTGEVYVWGNYHDKSPMMKNVEDIVSNDEAYAVLLKNGDVSVWGDAQHGGEFKYSFHTREYIGDDLESATTWTSITPPKNVSKLVASSAAFAAIGMDGSVTTWGVGFYGGNIYSDTSNKDIQHKKMSDIYSSAGGFLGIDSNHNINTWGHWWITDENLVNYTAFENPNWWSGALGGVGKGDYENVVSNRAAYAFSITNKGSSELYAEGRREIGGRIQKNLNNKVKGFITKITPHDCGFSAFNSFGDVYGWFGCNDDSLLDGYFEEMYKAKPYSIVLP